MNFDYENISFEDISTLNLQSLHKIINGKAIAKDGLMVWTGQIDGVKVKVRETHNTRHGEYVNSICSELAIKKLVPRTIFSESNYLVSEWIYGKPLNLKRFYLSRTDTYLFSSIRIIEELKKISFSKFESTEVTNLFLLKRAMRASNILKEFRVTDFIVELGLLIKSRKCLFPNILDFSPQNFVVDADGNLFLIDLDSVFDLPSRNVSLFFLRESAMGLRGYRNSEFSEMLETNIGALQAADLAFCKMLFITRQIGSNFIKGDILECKRLISENSFRFDHEFFPIWDCFYK